MASSGMLMRDMLEAILGGLSVGRTEAGGRFDQYCSLCMRIDSGHVHVQL